MNNDQFRRLLAQNGTAAKSNSTESSSQRDGSTPSTLGSRMRSSIPMTPRNVGGSGSVNFARQLREANAPPAKKFKSTAAPKGTKLASGYVDRSRLRDGTAEEDDVAKRIKALEEMVKLGQMEQEAFEKVRDEMIGGDIKNVHLVKGLDRRLLERARRGEDVYRVPEKAEETKTEQEEVPDVDYDAELDALEAKEVVPVVRVKQVDDDADISARKKRTRDDILREMKEARQKAAEQAKPQQAALGSRFRKVAEQMQPGTSRLEIDEQGREVLIVVDDDGNVKRKVKKSKVRKDEVQDVTTSEDKATAKSAAPLGADVVIPDRPMQPIEPEEEQDLFADAGTDYDPLAGLDESATDSGSESGEERSKARDSKNMPTPPPKLDKPRNYFNEKPTEQSTTTSNPAHDPEFLAALRKAASVADRLDKSGGIEEDEEKLRKLARHKEMLQAHDRDAEDLDMGFGSSRFDDQDEAEDSSVKISKWHGTQDDNDKDRGGQNNRKRGTKKKKGDKNSAHDVLAVLERRAKS